MVSESSHTIQGDLLHLDLGSKQLNTVHPFPPNEHTLNCVLGLLPPISPTRFHHGSSAVRGGTIHLLPSSPLVGRVMICKENH